MSNAPDGDFVDSGSAPQQDDYVSRPGQKDSVPVQRDDAPVDGGVDGKTADSDAALEADDRDAIDKSNIIDERTRGAGPDKGSYKEPGDEEGL